MTDWPPGKKILFAVLLALCTAAVPVIIWSGVPLLLLLILASVAGGLVVWWTAGKLTPFLMTMYLRLHERMAGAADVSREIALVDSTDGNDERWNALYRSLRLSLFPTGIALSLIGYVLRDIGSLGSRDVFLVLYLAPVIVVFMVPLWIVRDSPLFYHYPGTREVISMGRQLGIRLKSVGGVTALGLFLFTLYTVTGSLQDAAVKFVVFFSHIYPALVLTSSVYHARWHQEFVKRTARAAVEEGKREHRVRLEER